MKKPFFMLLFCLSGCVTQDEIRQADFLKQKNTNYKMAEAYADETTPAHFIVCDGQKVPCNTKSDLGERPKHIKSFHQPKKEKHHVRCS